MKVLAVDPGYERLGVAILESGQNKEKLLFSDCLRSDKEKDLPQRLWEIGTAFNDLILQHKPDTVALETVFFNKNQKTAVAVAQARGMLIYLAKSRECKVFEFGPQEVKVAVTGYGKSDKAAVIDMVKRLVDNAPAAALDDEYDAIAVGITCLAHHSA